jgi:hypothetical protein
MKSGLRAFHSNQVYSQSLVLVQGAKFIVCQSVQRTPTESGVEDPVNGQLLIVSIIENPSTTLPLTDPSRKIVISTEAKRSGEIFGLD